MIRAAIAAAVLATGAQANVVSMVYDCERGVRVHATYVVVGEYPGVVLYVEGQQVFLSPDRAASGVRYAQEGGGYVWHEKGPDAILIWDADGRSSPIYKECRAR